MYLIKYKLTMIMDNILFQKIINKILGIVVEIALFFIKLINFITNFIHKL